MPYNLITLSDLNGGHFTYHKTTLAPIEDAEVFDESYIDLELMLSQKDTHIPTDCITGKDTQFTLKIDNIEDPIENIPNHLISAIANVQTIITTHKYVENIAKNNLTYNQKLFDLVRLILKNSICFSEGASLVFDNVISFLGYDEFASQLISYCVDTDIRLKYLSLPISTLFYIAHKDNENGTDLLPRLLKQIKRHRIAEVSFNETISEKYEEYQKCYLQDNGKVYSDVFCFIEEIIDLNDPQLSVLIQELPPVINVHKVIEGSSPSFVKRNHSGELQLHSKLTYMRVIVPLLRRGQSSSPANILNNYATSSAYSKQNVFLFCNVDRILDLSLAPSVLVKWHLVYQLDEYTVEEQPDIGLICVNTVKSFLYQPPTARMDSNKVYQNVSKVIEKILYYNIFYLYVNDIMDGRVKFIDHNLKEHVLELPQNSLGVVELGDIHCEYLSNLNFFF